MNRKLQRCSQENNQFQSKSVQAKMITSKSISILKCGKIWIQVNVHLWSFSCIRHAKTTLSKQRQPRSCCNIPLFLQWTAPIERSFYEGCPGTTFTSWSKYHLVVIGKAEQQVCKSFTAWHQPTIEISRRAHLVSACLRYTCVVLHAHPVRGESHIHHYANWEAATLAAGLG